MKHNLREKRARSVVVGCPRWPEASFCVRPPLKTLRKPFGFNTLRTLKGYIMAVSRRSRHLLRKAQNESGGFPCVN